MDLRKALDKGSVATASIVRAIYQHLLREVRSRSVSYQNLALNTTWEIGTSYYHLVLIMN